MFKLVLFISFCVFMVAECQPANQENGDALGSENVRVSRNSGMQNAMHVAGQIAHGGLEVANKGAHILTAAAKKAVSAGMSAGATIAKTAAKGAITLL